MTSKNQSATLTPQPDQISTYKETIMKKRSYAPIVYCLLFLATNVTTGCVTFSGVDSASIEILQDDVHLSVAFNDHDREYIENYYHRIKKKHKKKYKKHMPPGLAKKGKLTPGHQKRLKKHGALPPGLTRYHLPIDLEERLRPLPSGYARVRMGGDIVLLNEATQIAVDIIYGID
jgi:hypothetical protein